MTVCWKSFLLEIERSFKEQRRGTKIFPTFFTEKSGLKLAFAALWRASLRWRKLRFTEHERKQMEKLRKTLGLESVQSIGTNDRKTETSVPNIA